MCYVIKETNENESGLKGLAMKVVGVNRDTNWSDVELSFNDGFLRKNPLR